MRKVKYVQHIATYESGGFLVDIVKESIRKIECFGAYLYRKNCGVKSYMFGAQPKDTTLEQFIDIVSANLADYKRLYDEDMEICERAYEEVYERG